MDWKINLILVISAITLLASVLGSLERITKILHGVVVPMFRWKYKRNGTWPLKLTLKSAKKGGSDRLPRLFVTVLIEPRKPICLGDCKIVYGPNYCEYNPETPLPSDYLKAFRSWESDIYLSNPRTYKLGFYLPENAENAQVQIESEGHISKSNTILVPRKKEVNNAKA